MALKSIGVLQQFFMTRKKPTQQQFWDWLDSFWHKDEMIPIEKIYGLVAIVNSYSPVVPLAPGVVQWTAPAGTMIRGFLIKDSGAGQDVLVKIGTTPGGSEIYDAEEIFNTGNADACIIDKSKTFKTDVTVFFTITGTDLTTISINIYKQ